MTGLPTTAIRTSARGLGNVPPNQRVQPTVQPAALRAATNRLLMRVSLDCSIGDTQMVMQRHQTPLRGVWLIIALAAIVLVLAYFLF